MDEALQEGRGTSNNGRDTSNKGRGNEKTFNSNYEIIERSEYGIAGETEFVKKSIC